jgi:hypothetical protein
MESIIAKRSPSRSNCQLVAISLEKKKRQISITSDLTYLFSKLSRRGETRKRRLREILMPRD